MSYKSTLVLDGDVHIENLDLDGSISISSKEKKEVKDLTFHEKNYVEFVPTDENETDTRLKMRGYKAVGTENIKVIS